MTTTGVMYSWGLTIEIVTSLNLILAIGLCVDYAAHIGEYLAFVVYCRQK